MAITYLSSTSASGTPDSVTTSGIDTSGASLLVMGLAYDSGSTASISDSLSNTWTALTRTSSGALSVRIYYCLNPKTGTGHTFTNAGSQNYSSIYVSAFKGVQTIGAMDNENGQTTTGTGIGIGNVTPTLNGELVITQLAFSSTGVPISIDSGFIELGPEIDFGSGNNYGGQMAYSIQTTATTVNTAVWTRTNSNLMASTGVIFRSNVSTGFFMV